MKVLLASWLFFSMAVPVFQSQENQVQAAVSLAIQAEAGAEAGQFRIIASNQSSNPVKLEFPTSEFYEVIILDQSGSEVYSSSKGRAFLQAIQYAALAPGGTKEWKESWNYSADGVRVPAGTYKAIVHLKASKVNGQPANPESLKAGTDITVPGVGANQRAEEPGQNTIFHQLKVSGSNGSYTVTGRARPRSGEFYYTVEDGHNQLVKETKMVTGSSYPQWSQFELQISIPTNQLPKNGTLLLNMYEKNSGGSLTGEPVAIVLQQFKGTN